MPVSNVSLSEQHADLIEALVESGRFASANDVFSEGLQLIADRETHDEAKLASIKAAVLEGQAAIDKGDHRTFSDRETLRAYIDGLAPNAVNPAGARPTFRQSWLIPLNDMA